jgi:hypothetical protein
MCPADPLDAALLIEDSSTNPCTSVNAVEPGWNRAIGSVTADNTCSWITLQGGDAEVAYYWNDSDSSTLSIVPLTQPDRPLNATSGGGGYVYPQNIYGELSADGFVEEISLLQGGRHAAHVTGRGNAAYADLGYLGTGNGFQAGLFETRAYARLVPATVGSNLTYKVGGVFWIQGEANASDSATTYASHVTQYQIDADTQIKLITGQTGTIPLFMSPQTSTAGSMLFNASGSMQGELDAANAFGSKVYIFAPKYQCEVAGDGTHRTGPCYRRLGILGAKVANSYLRNGTWVPTQPTQILVSGSTITITYNVPVGCLQWITTIPPPHQSGTYSDTGQGGTSKGWTSGKGFEVYKSGGTVQGIVSATISSCTQVTIVANGTDIGYVGYASVADASAACTGCEVRSGQLADSDTFVGYDQETLACSTTSGSATLTCTDTTAIDKRRGLWDSVSGTGIPSGTVTTARPGSGQFTMSANATSTGAPAVTFAYDMKNYGVPFQVQVANTSGVSAFEFPASTAGSQSRMACTGCLTGVKVWIATAGSPAGTTLAELTASAPLGNGAVELTGIPSLSASAYDLQVQNPYNAIQVYSNAITATASDTVLSIAGLRAVGYYEGSSAVQSGGNVSQVNDLSNRGNTFLDAAVASHPTTYTASSANANGQPTWSCDGSAYLKIATFNHAAAVGNGLYWMAVAKLTTPGTTDVPLQYNPTAYEWQTLATGVSRWTAPTSTWGSAATGAMKFFEMGRAAGLAGETHSSFFSVDNATDVTASGSYASSMQTSAAAAICARNNGTLGIVSEWAAVLWMNSVPTSGERSRLYTAMKGKFGSGI